jgi:hypothetical protein
MRVTIRLDGALGEQVAAARAERHIEMAALVREALTVYLAADPKPKPLLSWQQPAPQVAHSLDACTATVVEHWPPEIQAWLAAEAARTHLSLKNLLLGVVYAWTKRM